MYGMFEGATSFDQDLYWDVSSVQNLERTFSGASSFNGDITGWELPTQMGKMVSLASTFENAISFNQPIGNWTVTNVPTTKRMLKGAIQFNQYLSDWVLQYDQDMREMFLNAHAFNQSLCTWVDRSMAIRRADRVTDMFLNTSCVIEDSPGVDQNPKAGPYCMDCSVA